MLKFVQNSSKQFLVHKTPNRQLTSIQYCATFCPWDRLHSRSSALESRDDAGVLNNQVKQKLTVVYYKSENPIASSVFLGESSKVTQNLFSAGDTIRWSVL